ncbi:MAG: ABC transporter ATP-binding protein [Eubacteriales bacterium]|nr:ABC transporter ATP-binding protein [Eubacteriales bacterium]MDD3881402.1 ABC transporter ATP-binding protein [Eubacteriales bacterium]MDD4513089.1 ABC transporter ATP-binding protein [Eubacteriales bacterium]
MESNVMIRGFEITKTYSMRHKDYKGRLAAILRRDKPAETFTALNKVSFEIAEGEIVGLVGLNGSGKSTLSQIIAGITYPTSGEFEIGGSCSMLSASSGLNGNLTGLENIYYKCLLLGFSEKQIKQMEAGIIDFADIGEHIDQPLHTYSSGMRSRLGFAISISIDPKVLIVDEALAVGDQAFSAKCLAAMNDLKKKNTTIIFVSHSTGQMRGFCDRVMWLHKGKNVGFMKTDDILPAYDAFTKDFKRLTKDERQNLEPEIAKYITKQG